MTIPEERTRAVVETRALLQQLAGADEILNVNNVRDIAARLLRHYPLDVDLMISAVALPGVWCSPIANGTVGDF
ncbi:BPSL0761 family protein [Burkholderia seminalis]|uniref:BPSL0761 family protein n=1 Tax=Burkholderia seminalis TaxID=488731 RepID=UPI002656394C|nr:BPSL0761 family protein [Burkholderia seminalis]MDN7591902.1 BPSL0761 family protein [Burkholderia seminalis]